MSSLALKICYPQNRRIRVIDPIAAHWVIDFKIVTSSHLEIFKAVCRRRVYTAGSSLGRHVFAQHNGHGLVAKGGSSMSPSSAAFGSSDEIFAGDAAVPQASASASAARMRRPPASNGT